MEIGKSSRKSLHLHEEIIEEEILPRLPVKSLLRLRCVSKSWSSLIGSQRFTKKHHQNSKNNPSFLRQTVIIDTYSGEWPHQWPQPTLQIVGCCNGLLCILEKEEQIRIQLWNPSTRISKKLPEISISGFVLMFGFGWVESSDEYKVFVSMLYDYDQEISKVYSSKTKSWKTIELRSDLVSLWPRGVFAGGKLYWKHGFANVIVCLDLKSEVFGTIEEPLDQEEHCSVTMGVLGGFLCVLCYNYKIGFRVWVMKESWERVATFAHLVELLQPAPLVVREILVNCGSFVVVYDCRDNMFRDPKFCAGSCCQDNVFRSEEDCARSISYEVYVESLVSPKDL